MPDLGAVSARRDFLDYCAGLSRRLERGGPAITDQERTKLFALRDTWEEEYQARVRRVAAGGRDVLPERPPSRESVEAEFGTAPNKEGLSKPRHRPRSPIPMKKVTTLERELDEREKRRNPARGPWTLNAISHRVELTRDRVTQAVEIRGLGWDLWKSHPDFSTDEDHVVWPYPDEVPGLLG